MAYTFDQANANAPSKRSTQYFEMFANRGIYHEGWYACTTPPAAPWLLGTAKLPSVNDYKWELYNLAEDFSQNNDVAATYPDKLRELQALFLSEAAKYQVLPLDNSILPRLTTPRPSATAGRTVFTYTGANPGIPTESAPSIMNKDYKITAEITVPQGGAEGMIVTLGGRFSGYGLYLLKGKPVFVYNMLDLKRYRWEGGVGARDWLGTALKPGKHTIVFDFKYDGPGFGKGGTGVLSVDGKEYARQSIPHSIGFLMAIDESFDIGVDTRTGVDSSYKLPFQFTGKIDKLTFNLGPTQVSSDDQKLMRHALEKARD
jgi:arylsulfatase